MVSIGGIDVERQRASFVPEVWGALARLSRDVWRGRFDSEPSAREEAGRLLAEIVSFYGDLLLIA